jgi:hypothetical protein
MKAIFLILFISGCSNIIVSQNYLSNFGNLTRLDSLFLDQSYVLINSDVILEDSSLFINKYSNGQILYNVTKITDSTNWYRGNYYYPNGNISSTCLFKKDLKKELDSLLINTHYRSYLEGIRFDDTYRLKYDSTWNIEYEGKSFYINGNLKSIEKCYVDQFLVEGYNLKGDQVIFNKIIDNDTISGYFIANYPNYCKMFYNHQHIGTYGYDKNQIVRLTWNRCFKKRKVKNIMNINSRENGFFENIELFPELKTLSDEEYKYFRATIFARFHYSHRLQYKKKGQ